MTRQTHADAMLRGTTPSSIGARLVPGIVESHSKRFDTPQANPEQCLGTPAYRW